MVFFPFTKWLLPTAIVCNLYNPWIPCLAMALSSPFSPVEKWGSFAFRSLNLTWSSPYKKFVSFHSHSLIRITETKKKKKINYGRNELVYLQSSISGRCQGHLECVISWHYDIFKLELNLPCGWHVWFFWCAPAYTLVQFRGENQQCLTTITNSIYWQKTIPGDLSIKPIIVIVRYTNSVKEIMVWI